MTIVAVALLPPLAFYGGFDFAANRIVANHELPRTARNSVRHALASASVYDAFRRLGLNGDLSEGLTLSLGNLNEHVETYVKVGSPDSPAEVRKDLYNNWAGISAARWRWDNAAPESLGSLIAELAKADALMLHRVEMQGPDTEIADKVTYAIRWLDAEKQRISDKIADRLRHLANQI